MSRTTLIAGVAALALLAGACSGSDEQESSTLASDIEESGTTVPDSNVATTQGEAPTTEATEEASDALTFFPDVLDATATQADDGTWTFNVTLSSPYDTPEQYADAWRVVDVDGNELGIRILGHDHATEQPFTRSHSGIVIPDGITSVTIEGRDQTNGWGGNFLEFDLPI